MTPEQALIELSRATSVVRNLGKQIGAALGASYDAQTDNGGEYTDWLKLAYETAYDDDGSGYRNERYFVNHDHDVDGYLAEHCPHMLRAHQLIQERKKAKQALGVARRRITKLANRLAAKEPRHG